jgi:hypothetical protein
MAEECISENIIALFSISANIPEKIVVSYELHADRADNAGRGE